MGPYPLGTEVTIFHTFTVDAVEQDPTTVTFRVERPNGTIDTYVFGVDGELTNPSTGYYELAYLPPSPGTYNYEAVGEGAVIATSPTGSFDVLASGLGAPAPLEIGPCEPWVDPQDVSECCNIELGSSFGLFLGSAIAASQVLYRLSGKQFSPGCERVVRPQRQAYACGVQVLSRGYVINWDGHRWSDGMSRVLLPNFPVTEITEVKIDGAVLLADEYRLDGWRWLTRMADGDGRAQSWPHWQRMDREDTEEDTFSVAYRFGQPPPEIGVNAAAQLACEIYKACPGNEGVGDAECKIPKRSVRVTRNGVTLQLAALHFDHKKRSWETGLDLVDLFLNTYNPNGLTRPPLIWSPDDPQFAVEVGTALGS